MRRVNGPTFIHMFKEPDSNPFLYLVFPLEHISVPFKFRASVEGLLSHLFDVECSGSVKAKLLDMGLISDLNKHRLTLSSYLSQNQTVGPYAD